MAASFASFSIHHPLSSSHLTQIKRCIRNDLLNITGVNTCSEFKGKSHCSLYKASVTLTSLSFSRIPLQPCMPSNNASKPTFNDVSCEEHAQIVSRKPHSLYSIPKFTYTHQNYVITQKDTRYCETKDWTLVSDLLHNPCSRSLLALYKSVL